jgi:energy-coupling factor transport system permease protein
LLDLKALRITEEGLINAVVLSARMILAVLFSIVLSLTTSPLEISFSVEEIIGKFPAGKKRSSELGMALSLTLTFIPLISLQTNRIIMAQKARGVEFDKGSFPSRVKNSLSVVIPVITTSLKKAQDTAAALQIRGYKPGHKLTSLREKRWSSSDSILLVVTIFSVLSAIIL